MKTIIIYDPYTGRWEIIRDRQMIGPSYGSEKEAKEAVGMLKRKVVPLQFEAHA